MHAMCKKLEKRDRMNNVREVGPEPDAGTVKFPLGPIGTVQLGVAGRDSGCHGFPDSTVISVHSIADVRGGV